MVLSVFGDESADETKQRVFAVAAILADEDTWLKAETAWLARTGGVIFHAADCESEYANDPDRTKHAANLQMYADLSHILADSGVFGYGVAMDLSAQYEYFPGVPDDVGYYQCFTEVIHDLLRRAKGINQQHGTDAITGMKFTFDHRKESEHNAGMLYSSMVNLPEWAEHSFLSTKISFDSRANARIQMADLVARETMKHLDNMIGPVKRPTRKSLLALGEGESHFDFNMFTREYFQDKRQKFETIQEKAGITPKAFLDWLIAHKLTDNWSNRIRFLEWLRLKEDAEAAQV